MAGTGACPYDMLNCGQESAVGSGAGDHTEAHAFVELQRASGVLAVHAEGGLGHAEALASVASAPAAYYAALD